jgi:hypothetical protein
MTKIVNLSDIYLTGGSNGAIIGVVVAIIVIIIIVIVIIVMSSSSKTPTQTPSNSGSDDTSDAGSDDTSDAGSDDTSDAGSDDTSDAPPSGCMASSTNNLLSIANQTKMGNWPDTGMTAAQCQSACEGTVGCTGWWSYVNDTKDCYLAGGDVTLSSDSRTDRTVGMCTDTASSCPVSSDGNLLSITNQTKMGGWPDTGMTPAQCQASCENTPGCSGWWSYTNDNKDCYIATGDVTVTTDNRIDRTVGVCN